jgi:hypothetical protein
MGKVPFLVNLGVVSAKFESRQDYSHGQPKNRASDQLQPFHVTEHRLMKYPV